MSPASRKTGEVIASGGLRLGIDATPLASAKSGIGYHVEYLVRALARTGSLSEILLFSNREPKFDEGAPSGTRWIARRTFPKRALWMQALLPSLIREERPDLTHYINFNAPILGPHPFVVTFHDMVLFRHPEFFTWKKRVLTRGLMPHVARRALGILTVTEAARREIIEYLDLPPERVHVVPAAPADLYRPVDDLATIDAVRARHRLERPYLLFVGTLEPRKNLPRLLHAFARLKQELGLPHELAIVGGRGWKFDPIFATVQATGVAESVRFLDYVALPDMPALYAGADLLVFPSLYEGFGVPPLEAMRVGTPVVTSDVPALNEVAGDAAIKVDPFDVSSIASGMREGLTDQARRRELMARGLARGDLFTWDRSAEAAIRVYQAALGSAGAVRGPLPAGSTLASKRENTPDRSQAASLARIARLPWVRFAGIVDRPERDAAGPTEILLIAARGRRGCVLAETEIAQRLEPQARRIRVVSLLDESRLRLASKDSDGARLLSELRPLEGSPLYDILLDRNRWMRHFVGEVAPRASERLWRPQRGRRWQHVLEVLLTPFAILAEPILGAKLPSDAGESDSGEER